MRTNVEHGARIIFKINGARVALANNVEYTVRTPLQAVDPLGTVESFEHIRVALEVDISFSMYRAFDKSLAGLGIFPRTGDPREVLEHEDLMGEVEDLDGPGTIARFKGFKIEEYSCTGTKGQLSLYTCRGKAIKNTEEAEN